MANFVQGTQNLIDLHKSGFLGTATSLGKNTSNILDEDSMAGTSKYSVADYFESAVWITGPERTNSVKEQWISSFLGL